MIFRIACLFTASPVCSWTCSLLKPLLHAAVDCSTRITESRGTRGILAGAEARLPRRSWDSRGYGKYFTGFPRECRPVAVNSGRRNTPGDTQFFSLFMFKFSKRNVLKAMIRIRLHTRSGSTTTLKSEGRGRTLEEMESPRALDGSVVSGGELSQGSAACVTEADVCRVAVLGAPKVGKTTLARQLLTSEYLANKDHGQFNSDIIIIIVVVVIVIT